MKEKGLTVMLLALTLIIGMLGTLGFVTAAPADNVLAIKPLHTVWAEPANSIGDTFWVNLTITNASNVQTWTIILGWDPDILNVTDCEWGDFINYVPGVVPIEGAYDNVAGNFSAAYGQGATEDTMVTQPGVEITLLKVQFLVKDFAYPTPTLIEILEYELIRVLPSDYLTAGALLDGDFEFAPSANVPPTDVDFSWTPTFPTAAVQNVTFTAQARDPDAVGIANMTFDFGSVDANPTGAFMSDGTGGGLIVWNVEVNYTVAGTFTVTLTVWDKGKPGYYPANSTTVTKDIKVLPPAAPSGVDVYTFKSWLGNDTLPRNRGIDPLTPGSAFAPGEIVTLRSYAYYENIPVVDLNVGFQVNYPDGSLRASLAAITNASGIAQVSFRVPQAPLPPFGLYEVSSTSRIFETDFSDTLEFHVGWIVKINTVTVSPDPVAIDAPATITVDMTNFDPHDAYPVVLIVSVYDKLDQILGTESLVFDIPLGGVGTSTTRDVTITIPPYAWPGALAYAKANAYTDYPELGGTAYCPEGSDFFDISVT